MHHRWPARPYRRRCRRRTLCPMSRAHERHPADGTTTSRRAARPVQARAEDVGPRARAATRGPRERGHVAHPREAHDARPSRPTSVAAPRWQPRPQVRRTEGREGAAVESEVRIHDDTSAADLSKRLGAVAFTFGRDIFLSADAPDLRSAAGERMLGHELTHVQQQRASGTTRPRRVSAPGSPAEREAARLRHWVGASPEERCPRRRSLAAPRRSIARCPRRRRS